MDFLQSTKLSEAIKQHSDSFNFIAG